MTAIEFTQEEARVLLTLIDVAVKAAGLPAAEAAAVLSKKIAPVAQPAEESTGPALVHEA